MLIILTLWVSVANAQKQNLRVTLKVNGAPLHLEEGVYVSAAGDKYQIETVRFYLSRLEFLGKSRVQSVDSKLYHLIDAEEPLSTIIELKDQQVSEYDSLRFLLGTDSMVNVSGVLGGDLDPTKGMYWAWNSGYINLKIEGKSTSCLTRNHAFEFHLGGYMPPNQTMRQITIPIQNKHAEELNLIVDLGKYFDQIPLAEVNSVMIPSKEAVRLMDLFKDCFIGIE